MTSNRRNKRTFPPMDFSEESGDSDSDSDYDQTYFETSSDESDDESDDDTPEVVQPEVDVTWKDIPSTFRPRKVIPEYQATQTDVDETATIIDVFLKLFPNSLFIWISDCTNERLNILSQKKGKPITPTDPHEIMIVMGCLLVMSYNRVPHLYMYWSQNKSLRNETIATAISRDRFMLIHSKLYFNKPQKPNGADKTYYMNEMINCLVYTFNRYRTEGTYQSIDEFMVAFKGRSSMKQYLPKKPVKRGIKGFCRADASTGYVNDLFVFQGKQTEPLEGTLGERVSIYIKNN